MVTVSASTRSCRCTAIVTAWRFCKARMDSHKQSWVGLNQLAARNTSFMPIKKTEVPERDDSGLDIMWWRYLLWSNTPDRTHGRINTSLQRFCPQLLCFNVVPLFLFRVQSTSNPLHATPSKSVGYPSGPGSRKRVTPQMKTRSRAVASSSFPAGPNFDKPKDPKKLPACHNLTFLLVVFPALR